MSKWVAKDVRLYPAVPYRDGFREIVLKDDHNKALAEKDQQYQQLMTQALEIATEFTDKMSAHGEWDDGCFYYNKYASPELQGLIGVVQAFLKEHQ